MRKETQEKLNHATKLIDSGMEKTRAIKQAGLSPNTYYQAQKVVVTTLDRSKKQTPSKTKTNKVAMIIGDTHSIAQMIRELL